MISILVHKSNFYLTITWIYLSFMLVRRANRQRGVNSELKLFLIFLTKCLSFNYLSILSMLLVCLLNYTIDIQICIRYNTIVSSKGKRDANTRLFEGSSPSTRVRLPTPTQWPKSLLFHTRTCNVQVLPHIQAY